MTPTLEMRCPRQGSLVLIWAGWEGSVDLEGEEVGSGDRVGLAAV